MSTALAVALPDPVAVESSTEEWAVKSWQSALQDEPLLNLVAEASAGSDAPTVMLGETAAFLRACDLNGLRRALLAMEFSFEIAEMEMANPGI